MYFCSENRRNVKVFGIFMLLFSMAACSNRQSPAPVRTPWGDVLGQETDTASFDLDDIERAGELIALTLSGPASYYEYRGMQLGVHQLLCRRWASSLGVRLRVEVCRDTAEMLRRMAAGEGDVIAFPLQRDTLTPGWMVDSLKPQLLESLLRWYKPSLMAEVAAEEQRLLKGGGVKRRVFAPMLNRAGGVISRYDGLFRQYSVEIGWDWRLMAAQCYQESTFDPMAQSWAGARGLMQIMPTTADHLGLARADMTDPEKNIAAAARYLHELYRHFNDISNVRERQDFVLASYNGGESHIRDAMRLAERDGLDARRWSVVAAYVLRLSDPQYYQDPLVHHGYMRGAETKDYVERIRARWMQYRGVKGAPGGSGTPHKSYRGQRKAKYTLRPSAQ